jgi:SAM-dependent methyltransferase
MKSANEQHWDKNLDAQNLARGGPQNIERDVALYQTADVREAIRFLRPAPGIVALDIGGGLGLAAVLLARAGATVIIADLSLNRLNKARELMEALDLADRVLFVRAAAEELPFHTASIDRIFIKAVLIHTRLGEACREIARILARDGRAAFSEPRAHNPLANLYRATLAPPEWKGITRYFDHRSDRELTGAFRRAGWSVAERPYFLLGFLAGVFHYALPNPRIHALAEALLLPIDNVLFRLPVFRRLAWFSLYRIKARKRSG